MQEGKVYLNSTKAIKLIKKDSAAIWIFSLVIICLILSNPQETNAQLIYCKLEDFFASLDLSMLVGSSETVRTLSIGKVFTLGSAGIDSELKIRQWIAGVTDGDGNLYFSGKGYVEYSVVMEARDIACLYKLKAR
jgi:hypothetical protein